MGNDMADPKRRHIRQFGRSSGEWCQNWETRASALATWSCAWPSHWRLAGLGLAGLGLGSPLIRGHHGCSEAWAAGTKGLGQGRVAAPWHGPGPGRPRPLSMRTRKPWPVCRIRHRPTMRHSHASSPGWRPVGDDRHQPPPPLLPITRLAQLPSSAPSWEGGYAPLLSCASMMGQHSSGGCSGSRRTSTADC